MLIRLAGSLALGLLLPAAALASVSAIDDEQHSVTLPAPARRIVSLAPHVTELLYAAGAGSSVVAVSDYSDYPAEAKRAASVGGIGALDVERIIALQPDLVVVWGSGNFASQVAKLRALQIPVFVSEPRDYATIASSLERLAHLAGSDAIGLASATAFRTRLKRIEATYRQRPSVSVFYQVWRKPLITLNGTHMVSTAIRLCGGDNIFSKLPQIAPTVSVEDVLKANPEAIITADSNAKNDSLTDWQRFPALTAVARGNLYTLNADWINRAGPRILDGTEALCKQLDQVRSKRR